jgi:hypothetical protein
MTATTAKILRALFVAYVIATVVHIAYVVNHEPYAFDAWNVSVDTGAKPFSLGRFFAFWHQQYTSSNPRIGQPITYFAYKLTGFAEIGTALAYLALVVGGFVVSLRRWPKLRDGHDLATLSIGIGFLWFAAPYFASFMFCRAYATNYVWSAAFQLWFVAAIRLHEPEHSALSIPKVVGIFLLGIVCGMGNEHVGPTLALFSVGYAVWMWRRHHRLSPLLAAAAVGACLGFALILFAPGQAQRYEGLAERYTLIQQILFRGISGNLDIFINYLYAAAPILAAFSCVIAVGIVFERRPESELADVRASQRRALAFVAAALVAGTLMTFALFASPKLGWRFYMHGCILLLAGVMATASTFLYRARSFAPFVAFAVITSTFAAAKTVPLFTRLARASDERLALLEAAPRGDTITLDGWEQVQESWWFLGDDARDQMKDELIAKYFGLHRVLFRGGDMWSTLGVTDVKLTMHYDLDPPACLDEIETLDLKPFIGRDVGALHHAFLDTIAQINDETTSHVKSVDLVATFLGKPPPMPRKRIYVARWQDGKLEGYVSDIKRVGRTRDREVVMSPELAHGDFEIYVVAVGDEPKKLGTTTEHKPLRYQPWRSAEYWFLACKSDYCFVTFATRHKA